MARAAAAKKQAPPDEASDGESATTPQEWQKLWETELGAARKELRKWHKRGRDIDKRFRDDRPELSRGDTRWNLFTANVRTQRASLYGKTPTVNVSRRFADPEDDVARVAGELLERLLNTDIERDGDGYALALQSAIDDYLLPGLGCVRARYEMDEEDVEEVPAKLDAEGNELAPAQPAGKQKSREDVEVDYAHWQDQLWSPARVWQEVRWWGGRAEMSRAQLVKRFGVIGKRVPLNAKKTEAARSTKEEPSKPSPWGRAEVWEIWSKEHKKVFWYVEGFSQVLDVKDDPLQIRGFWPFPRPLVSVTTTSAFIPTPDFALSQDLYNEVDLVSTKITELQDALRVAGVYDGKNKGIESLLESGGRNQLIPITNWGSFAEKGGLAGAVDWMPIEQIAKVLDILRQYRTELISALDQIEGTSDLMRGAAADVEETARATGIKAKFGSIRLQSKQDEIARFASETQWIKAQIIARFFDVETILERANAKYMAEDQAVVQQAAELIKSRLYEYRVQVKPENISLTDFAALKQESLEVLEAIGAFIQQVAPIAQQMPGSMVHLLKLLQWAIARLRGASTVEGILDRAVTQAETQAQQPQAAQPPDPRVQAAQLKIQGDAQKAQFEVQKQQAEAQHDIIRTQAETQAEAAKSKDHADQEIRKTAAVEQIKAAHRPPPVRPGASGATGGRR